MRCAAWSARASSSSSRAASSSGLSLFSGLVRGSGAGVDGGFISAMRCDGRGFSASLVAWYSLASAHVAASAAAPGCCRHLAVGCGSPSRLGMWFAVWLGVPSPLQFGRGFPSYVPGGVGVGGPLFIPGGCSFETLVFSGECGEHDVGRLDAPGPAPRPGTPCRRRGLSAGPRAPSAAPGPSRNSPAFGRRRPAAGLAPESPPRRTDQRRRV